MNQYETEYTITFQVWYMKSLHSRRVATAKGTTKLKTRYELQELQNAPPESEVSKGIVKLIHHALKRKVKGQITSIKILSITPTV